MIRAARTSFRWHSNIGKETSDGFWEMVAYCLPLQSPPPLLHKFLSSQETEFLLLTNLLSTRNIFFSILMNPSDFIAADSLTLFLVCYILHLGILLLSPSAVLGGQ